MFKVSLEFLIYLFFSIDLLSMIDFVKLPCWIIWGHLVRFIRTQNMSALRPQSVTSPRRGCGSKFLSLDELQFFHIFSSLIFRFLHKGCGQGKTQYQAPQGLPVLFYIFPIHLSFFFQISLVCSIFFSFPDNFGVVQIFCKVQGLLQ